MALAKVALCALLIAAQSCGGAVVTSAAAPSPSAAGSGQGARRRLTQAQAWGSAPAASQTGDATAASTPKGWLGRCVSFLWGRPASKQEDAHEKSIRLWEAQQYIAIKRGELDAEKTEKMMSVSQEQFQIFDQIGAEQAGSYEEWVELIKQADSDALEELANILSD